jgi:hypothetical protein
VTVLDQRHLDLRLLGGEPGSEAQVPHVWVLVNWKRGKHEGTPKKHPTEQFSRWIFAEVVKDVPCPQAKEGRSEQHPWWQVVYLTGVGYVSTLRYIPTSSVKP